MSRIVGAVRRAVSHSCSDARAAQKVGNEAVRKRGGLRRAPRCRALTRPCGRPLPRGRGRGAEPSECAGCRPGDTYIRIRAITYMGDASAAIPSRAINGRIAAWRQCCKRTSAGIRRCTANAAADSNGAGRTRPVPPTFPGSTIVVSGSVDAGTTGVARSRTIGTPPQPADQSPRILDTDGRRPVAVARVDPYVHSLRRPVPRARRRPVPCSNCARAVNAAALRCRRTDVAPGSAVSSAPTASVARSRCSRARVRTAVANWSRARPGRPPCSRNTPPRPYVA
jgi:hypothetical protein